MIGNLLLALAATLTKFGMLANIVAVILYLKSPEDPRRPGSALSDNATHSDGEG